jgi:hypothetical protein
MLKNKNLEKTYNYESIIKFKQPQPADFNDNYSNLVKT